MTPVDTLCQQVLTAAEVFDFPQRTKDLLVDYVKAIATAEDEPPEPPAELKAVIATPVLSWMMFMMDLLDAGFTGQELKVAYKYLSKNEPIDAANLAPEDVITMLKLGAFVKHRKQLEKEQCTTTTLGITEMPEA